MAKLLSLFTPSKGQLHKGNNLSWKVSEHVGSAKASTLDLFLAFPVTSFKAPKTYF